MTEGQTAKDEAWKWGGEEGAVPMPFTVTVNLTRDAHRT